MHVNLPRLPIRRDSSLVFQHFRVVGDPVHGWFCVYIYCLINLSHNNNCSTPMPLFGAAHEDCIFRAILSLSLLVLQNITILTHTLIHIFTTYHQWKFI